MRIAFVNLGPHDYDVDTPLSAPLAGSESAQVYLALALARRGHAVDLVTATRRPGTKRGVRCRTLALAADDLPGCDAVVVSNALSAPMPLRDLFGPRPALLAWQHDTWINDRGRNRRLFELTGPRDRVVCVSDWHKAQFVAQGGLAPERIVVLKNAVSPVFEDLFAPDEDIPAAKASPPVLAFTSAPYKGLAPALAFFAEVRRRRGDVTLDLFSGFSHYPPGNALRNAPEWAGLSQAAADTPGVRDHGPVPQAEMAAALRRAAILFYPCIAPETASIAAMEAMAAGCVVVTTDLGALSETTAGFARLVPCADGTVRAEPFVEAALGVLERFDRGDPALGPELRRQVDHVRATCTWAARAAEAEAAFAALVP